MSYLLLKHLHTTAAGLSILFFIIRAYWSVTNSTLLRNGFVRITPHIIDTVLLACGVALAVTLGATQPWIWAKVVGVVLYIAIGTIAIKRGKTPGTRAFAAIVAVAIFFYIVGVAITKSPLSWFM